MQENDIRLFRLPIKLVDVPDEPARQRLHGVLTDCLQRLLPPLFVSGNSAGHAFSIRTPTGLGIQIRLPSPAPTEAILMFGWNSDSAPAGYQDTIANIIREVRSTLQAGAVDFLASVTIDIGTNRIRGRHQIADGVVIAGALQTHRIELATIHEHKSRAVIRQSQEFRAVFGVAALSEAEACLAASRPAAELALFLTALLRYPVYRGPIEASPVVVGVSDFPADYDLRAGQGLETHIIRPDLHDHDAVWMNDQLIYPDPTPYPSDTGTLFKALSELPAVKRERFFAGAHAYRLALRLLIREFLRGFLPEQSYSIALFQTALEALAHPADSSRLLSSIKKRTPAIFGHYRASPLADSARIRNPVLHEGQLFGGEMDPDPAAQMGAGGLLTSYAFFRQEAAKAETVTAAVLVDWLLHGGG